jgi:hypothetical protein
MNIKSLLLGSAAALVAVSGARAADAVVVAEPEPVEYVRVCDVYGAGFFYIPGTETCLAISGYVWYQIAANGYDEDHTAGVDNGDTYGYFGGATGGGWMKSVRARVNFDARSETEWGTLRGYIRLQATWNGYNTVDGPVSVDQGYIQLGGLMMGYTESAWAATQYGGASNWGSHSWGGMYYGYQQRHLIAYSFQGGNGFFGTISLEDDGLTGEGYMPDVVAKIGVNQGWGSVWAKVAYDESFSGSIAPFFGTANSGGWAASIGAQINVPNMPGSSLRVIGFWADGAHDYNVGAPNTSCVGCNLAAVPPVGFFGGAEWSVLASYQHQFSSTLAASVAFQYFNNLYYRGGDVSSGVDAWGAEVSVVWTPVTNFEVRAEVHYDDVGQWTAHTGTPNVDTNGTISGYLRFTRYF